MICNTLNPDFISGVKCELIIDTSNFLKEKVMEETYFDSNEFFDLKNSFINLQSDNQLDENDNQLMFQ
jgi:hypothetical protein